MVAWSINSAAAPHAFYMPVERGATRAFAQGGAIYASSLRATRLIACQSCAFVTVVMLSAAMHSSSRPRRACSMSTACTSERRIDSP